MTKKYELEIDIEKPSLAVQNKKKNGLAPNVILLIFIVIDMSRFFQLIPYIIANTLYVFIGCVAIVFVLFKKGIYKQRAMIFFIFVYTVGGMVGILINNNMDIVELFWPIAFFGIGLLLLNFNVSYRLTQLTYYLYNIIMIYVIVSAGSVDFINLAASRNSISVSVLLYLSLYLITAQNQEKKITLIPVVFGFITSFLAVGRSGILTFAILLIFMFIYQMLGNKPKVKDYLKSILIISVVTVALNFIYKVFGEYFYNSILNFQVRGTESVRTFIWIEYMNKTFSSIIYFIFGAPINGAYYLDTISENLHNSLFMLHAKYGILNFCLVIILMVNSLVIFLKEKNIIFVFLFISIIFRMQFDYTNFNAQLDIILMYFLFYPFYKKLVREEV